MSTTIRIPASGEIEVHVPRTPNFIRVGSEMRSIADFNEKQLREIGARWVEELVKRARSKR